MRLLNMLPFRRSLWLGIAICSAVPMATAADAFYQSYCSTQNTGSDYNAVTNIYQSDGSCHDQCNGDGYAFAVVQWQQCWCSNYIPADQASVNSDCNQSCPGFPDEKCGNVDTGYYGYIALDSAPSGTLGAAAASPTIAATSFSQSSTEQASSEEPVTSFAPVTTPITTPSTSSTSIKPKTTSAAPSTIVTPVTSVIVQTVSGAAVTKTVTSTPVVVPGSNPDSVRIERKSGLGAGAVAGIVIGVVAGLAIIAVAAFCLWRRRRSGDDDEHQQGSFTGSKKSMTRNVSVLSKAGLLVRGHRPSMSEREHDDSYYITPATGSNSVRHSMMFGAGDGVSPTSPLDSSHSGTSRRPSKPMVYDQRLNPSALFANQEANGSRVSMQDQQDYSRPLGVTNPDPRPSFESRISHTH